jgi:hypothetical protein
MELGFQLWVTPSGAKFWNLAHRVAGEHVAQHPKQRRVAVDGVLDPGDGNLKHHTHSFRGYRTEEARRPTLVLSTFWV